MTREAQSDATRRSLLSVARATFARNGYAGASIGDIAQQAEVTHGALYHHFENKRALFAAVCEDVEQTLVDRLVRSDAGDGSPLSHGCDAFLDACEERDFQRIILLDAPAVLGWETWHEMDARHGLALLTRAVQAEMRSGQIPEHDAASLAYVIHGALNEAGHAIARADDTGETRARMGRAVEALLQGLRAAARSGGG